MSAVQQTTKESNVDSVQIGDALKLASELLFRPPFKKGYNEETAFLGDFTKLILGGDNLNEEGALSASFPILQIIDGKHDQATVVGRVRNFTAVTIAFCPRLTPFLFENRLLCPNFVSSELFMRGVTLGVFEGLTKRVWTSEKHMTFVGHHLAKSLIDNAPAYSVADPLDKMVFGTLSNLISDFFKQCSMRDFLVFVPHFLNFCDGNEPACLKGYTFQSCVWREIISRIFLHIPVVENVKLLKRFLDEGGGILFKGGELRKTA